MFYENFPYNIYNSNQIEAYIQQQQCIQQQSHNNEQKQNIVKLRKAIRDYLEAARNVSPDYHHLAMQACIEEIMLQATKDGCRSL